MSSHKTRLQQLEKQVNEQPAQKIEVIEVHKSYDDGHTEIETIAVKNEQP